MVKNAQNSYFLSFFASCSPVNSCIIGCIDIFGQLCQTNVYIANFQGDETLKITLKLALTVYAWVWVQGLF